MSYQTILTPYDFDGTSIRLDSLAELYALTESLSALLKRDQTMKVEIIVSVSGDSMRLEIYDEYRE
jgi:hypothetical protein